jgi:multimeric flavodoxin WrbA
VCTISDDYGQIRDKLLACDGFIFASPNYINSVTAQLKALFDRCNGLIHCMALEGKYAAMVETSGSGDDDAVVTYMAGVANALGAYSVGGVASPQAGIRTFPAEEQLFTQARSLGSDLCSSIAEKRQFPAQDRFIAGFRLRMSGLVAFMQNHWSYERDFWQRKGAVVRPQ